MQALFGRGAFAADTVKFTLVLVNDIYKMGEEKGRGGFARLAGIIASERARSTNVLVFHAGDTLSPSLMSGFDQGAHIIELLNVSKPDVFVPGNHEFDFGEAVYLKRMGEANFPIFAANLRDGKGAMLPKHQDRAIFDLSGLKVGVVGLALAATKRISAENSLAFALGDGHARRAGEGVARRGGGFHRRLHPYADRHGLRDRPLRARRCAAHRA